MEIFHVRRQELKSNPGHGEWVGLTRTISNSSPKTEYHPYAIIYACRKCGKKYAAPADDTPQGNLHTPFLITCTKCGDEIALILDNSDKPPIGYQFFQVNWATDYGNWWTYQGSRENGEPIWTQTQLLKTNPVAANDPSRQPPIVHAPSQAEWEAAYPIITGSNKWVTANKGFQAMDDGFGLPITNTTSQPV